MGGAAQGSEHNVGGREIRSGAAQGREHDIRCWFEKCVELHRDAATVVNCSPATRLSCLRTKVRVGPSAVARTGWRRQSLSRMIRLFGNSGQCHYGCIASRRARGGRMVFIFYDRGLKARGGRGRAHQKIHLRRRRTSFFLLTPGSDRPAAPVAREAAASRAPPNGGHEKPAPASLPPAVPKNGAHPGGGNKGGGKQGGKNFSDVSDGVSTFPKFGATSKIFGGATSAPGTAGRPGGTREEGRNRPLGPPRDSTRLAHAAANNDRTDTAVPNKQSDTNHNHEPSDSEGVPPARVIFRNLPSDMTTRHLLGLAQMVRTLDSIKLLLKSGKN